MSVVAITPDYEDYIEYRDEQSLYHGAMLVYVHWEEHISFVSAFGVPLPPGTPFGAICEIAMGIYGDHPDAARIDWSQAEWMIDDERATPDFGKSIVENGIGHKSLIRFWTPGLHGYQGTAN
ncbi:phenol hydroxylase subunit P4 [Acidocella sp. KAb 2-4]|uniref:phenol hydroxylase subunit P4 n=1 Tax=Acidocella sp. KAb 2-4 TaxID=2885158 RepID=UPI001D091EDF|nr:phenol hydroxylase subunit P4 [Acidocella sp. KAb 2-4]MCB5945621.1 phenol hydroxylase subunit P4 [Acidocella sp. KAb 2-4]